MWDGYSKLTYVWELRGFYSWFHIGIFLNEIVRCHHCTALLRTVLIHSLSSAEMRGECFSGRQKDPSFTEMVHRMRMGTMIQEDIDDCYSRVDKGNNTIDSPLSVCQPQLFVPTAMVMCLHQAMVPKTLRLSFIGATQVQTK